MQQGMAAVEKVQGGGNQLVVIDFSEMNRQSGPGIAFPSSVP